MGIWACLFSPYNNMTVAKYCMLVYSHIKVCLQLPFLTRNISGVTTHEPIMAISQFAIELGFFQKRRSIENQSVLVTATKNGDLSKRNSNLKIWEYILPVWF